MKILLVDDEDRSRRQTCSLAQIADPDASITEAHSRDEALAALAADEFDLIICDLRIPPTRASADIREEYGQAVHATARQVCPGTPIVFLTAFSTNTNLRTQLSSGGVGRIFGLANVPMVQLITKTEKEIFLDLVRGLAVALQDLDKRITLESARPLDEMFDRGARAYASELGYDAVEVEGLSGLSGARVGRLLMQDGAKPPAAVFMKVAHFDDARDEHDRFVSLVANRLQPGSFAAALPPMTSGLRKETALFSTLANSQHVSLFRLLEERPEKAAQVVESLRINLQPFETNNPSMSMSLGDLRRESISDAKLSEFVPNITGLSANESVNVDIRRSLAHGDLHGENVLVDELNRPILIDFGDVGTRSAALDPVTLELSVLFHVNGPATKTSWFSEVDWSTWPDVDSFAAGSPFEQFIRACRSWALDRDTPQAVFATAYAHSFRQVKYPDVADQVAIGLAEAARLAM